MKNYNIKKQARRPAINKEETARARCCDLPEADDVSMAGVLVGLDEGRRLGSGSGEEVGTGLAGGGGTGTESVVATGPRWRATTKEASWSVAERLVVLKVHVNPPVVVLVRDPIAGA